MPKAARLALALLLLLAPLSRAGAQATATPARPKVLQLGGVGRSAPAEVR